MNTQQDAQTAAQNIFQQNQQENLSKIPKRKKHNSSIITAGLSVGVHPSVIEMFLPQMLEITKIINENEKNNISEIS